MNEKQQQLLFDKGITNLPSDALCSDNTLSNAENLIYRDGEHRVIQSPKKIATLTGKLLVVHRIDSNTVKYITYSGSYLYGAGTIYSSLSGVPTATTCGNFLIVNDDNGIHYFLWKGNAQTYKNVGQKLPELTVNFRIGGTSSSSSQTLGGQNNVRHKNYVQNSQNDDGIFNNNPFGIAEGKQEDYNNLVIGLYEKNKKGVNERNAFCEPFMACAAVELFDGSYVLHTAPQLLFPAVRCNTMASHASNLTRASTKCHYLYFNASFDYSEYSDIVKDVVVFITDGAKLYDTTIDQTPVCDYDANYWDGVVNGDYSYLQLQSDQVAVNFLPLATLTDAEILDNIRSNGLFYRAFSLGIKRNSSGWEEAKGLIKRHVLDTLTTQEQLPIDYFSNCPLSGDVMKSLNQRLHLASIKRGYAPITGKYISYDVVGGDRTLDFYVEIETPEGTRVVHNTKATSDMLGYYFYYPDPRAKKAYIGGNGSYWKINLKEHSSLNGAFYLEALPPNVTAVTETGTPNYPSTPEHFNNQLYVSEANNPLVFRPEGVVAVGKGTILALASQTAALSEGQFGQFPLNVFTTEGIWALNMNNTGVYTSTHPMSREVMTNKKTFVETDGSVFFISKKGLMVVVGSQVKCMSDQLSGRNNGLNFDGLFNDCLLAYDYRDSLIWIFPNDANVTSFTDRSLVYSMASGSFATFLWGYNPSSVVNDYPDTLLQDGDDLYSLMQRPDINNDGTTSGGIFTPNLYSAKLVTRPLKLENALALKTIMQARHITDMKPQQTNPPTMTWQVEASNNMETWLTLSSLTGKPWKYYRFTYTFSNLRATDTFAGTVLITQERRTNKLR